MYAGDHPQRDAPRSVTQRHLAPEERAPTGGMCQLASLNRGIGSAKTQRLRCIDQLQSNLLGRAVRDKTGDRGGRHCVGKRDGLRIEHGQNA
jgi:hypothetical protein